VDGSTPLNAVACPSTSQCVAVDDSGNVLTSVDPTGGSAAWQVANVDGQTPLGAVGCASSSLCVAVDDNGDVISSTDPTGGAGAWRVAQVDPGNTLNGVACPSPTVCVAVDDGGNIVTSTDPTGGAAAWSIASVDPGNSLNAVSCSTPSQCVAVDDAGNEVNSINPAAGDSAWTGTQFGVPSGTPMGGRAVAPLEAISCPAEAICVALDAAGNAYVGRPTPSNLVLPTITGTAAVGQTLQETNGNWTDSPTSVGVFWERCDAGGNGCSPIARAGGQSYTLTAADAGSTLRVLELASNANGDGTPAESSQTAVVTWQSPASTSPPGISGKPVQGQTLTEAPGNWTNLPTGYGYQWQDCDSSGNSCSAIAVATANTYSPGAGDVGHTIRVQETARNPGGQSAPATSIATGIVQVAPGTSGTASVASAKTKGTSASLAISCTGGPGATCGLTVILTVTETTQASRVIAVTAAKTKNGKIHTKLVTLGTLTTTLSAGQSQTDIISLNGTGRKLLAQHHTLKVRLSVSENGRQIASSTIAFKTKPQPTKRGGKLARRT
jgi:hypothetical protein